MERHKQNETNPDLQSSGESIPGHIPLGFKLRHTLRRHEGMINGITWAPDGQTLASGSRDGTIRLWDTRTGTSLHTLRGHTGPVLDIGWAPDGQTLASGSRDGTIRLWDARTGAELRMLTGHTEAILSVAWSADGRTLATGCADGTLRLWDARTKVVLRTLQGNTRFALNVLWAPDGRSLVSVLGDGTVRFWDATFRHRGLARLGSRVPGLAPGAEAGAGAHTLAGHTEPTLSVAWSANGHTLALGALSGTIGLWNPATGRLTHVLKGHTSAVKCVAFSPDGHLLASKAIDHTVRLWCVETWEVMAVLHETTTADRIWSASLAFHPQSPVLATLGEEDRVVHVWDLDMAVLQRSQSSGASTYYRNAKVVLVGDTGVGKSGLGLVLTGQPFQATESTHGRHVWTFETRQQTSDRQSPEIRETLLWDLAGQPGYRLLHQMHLHEVAVALVVFDARSEMDPLAGVWHWERALRQAQQRQSDTTIPLKKFLVAARVDRGSIAISKQRLDATVRHMGFDGFFETSAKAGWQIAELAAAIRNGIAWDALPRVTSTPLVNTVKQFVREEQQAGRLLATADDLFRACRRTQRDLDAGELRTAFDACLGLLENRDLIRQLSFGGYVLLQPELLDAYASAMLHAAQSEPDGLGSIAEEEALAGRFRMPQDIRIQNRYQEQLVLLATVEELLAHELVWRESADDGRYLVFPSQCSRDWEEAPVPRDTALLCAFAGPVQSIYTTLVVRLAHSGRFTADRLHMWRNAVLYTASSGGQCGIYLRELTAGRGQLILFFDQNASEQTRYQFEEYVLQHLERRALAGTVEVHRASVCRKCGTAVPEVYAAGRLSQGFAWIECAVCSTRVLLTELKQALTQPDTTGVARLEDAADAARAYDVWLTSAGAEVLTSSFTNWVGASDATLAIVFTDVVGSTTLANDLGSERMYEVWTAHTVQTRHLLEKYHGREVKTMGDGFLVAFRTAIEALDFALALYADTGHEQVAIRVGIH
ncbi:MAG TPA: adenylate/guanylate cyclase domain-containing protein, partial [Candidatus Tectomicrobia bacterium]